MTSTTSREGAVALLATVDHKNVSGNISTKQGGRDDTKTVPDRSEEQNGDEKRKGGRRQKGSRLRTSKGWEVR